MRPDRAAVASTPTPSAAEQRLAASREKIRAALAPSSDRNTDGNDAGTRSSFRQVKQLLATWPIARLAMRSAERWWRQHPWHSRVEFAIDATDALVRPAAQKHPLLLLTAALVVGAVIARTKPWRLLSSGALLASVLPQVRWASVIDWVTAMLQELPAHADKPTHTTPTPTDTDKP